MDKFKILFPRFIRTTYDLSQSLHNKLLANNIRLKSEIDLLHDCDFQEKGFTKEEISEINRKIKTEVKLEDLCCNDYSKIQYIRIGGNGFDQAFSGNGLSTGRLTQISGEAGVGKSQICLQLCLKVQLDPEEGGLNAEVLYFDTEDGFRPERIYQMAINYFSKINSDIGEGVLNYKAEEVLTRVHVRKINTDAEDLCNIILNGQLESFLDFHPRVKLFILDSIAYHFRYDYEHDDETRTLQLIQIACKLKQIAFKRNIAIVITNQVSLSNNMPALGSTWNSICSTSLLLTRNPSDRNQTIVDETEKNKITLKLSLRQCTVLKSISTSYISRFNYVINELGVQDFNENNS